MIKILFILPKTAQGGGETQLLYLLNGLDKNKFEVHLGLLYEHSQLENEFRDIDNVRIVKFKKSNKFDVFVYFKIARYLRLQNINIVQTFFGNHHAYLPSLMSNCSIAVGGIRGTLYDDKSFLYRLVEVTIPKFLTNYGKLILVANSYKGRESYLQKGFSSDNIIVIPNGIDYTKYSSGKSECVVKELNLSGKYVLIMVARLCIDKRHKDLLISFQKLVRYYPNLILLVVGDGPLKSDLLKLSDNLGLNDSVRFLGSRKDIPDLLSASDLFVFASNIEGWPNVIGEAMSAGLPVISYDVGDVGKIIRDGQDGFVISKNKDLLYEKIYLLINNGSLAKKIGVQGKKRIKNDFNMDKMVYEYSKTYFSLLNKNVGVKYEK